jgi:hypothetical protein
VVLDQAASAGITPADEKQIRDYVASILEGRRTDPDLAVPAGQRKRYEAAFARFSQLFPNAFYLAGVYWEHRSSALTDFPKLFPANQMARSKAIRFCITLYKTFL